MAYVSFSIRIVDEDGDPLEGISVSASEKGLFGASTPTEYTNEDGWVEFSIESVVDDWFCLDVSIGIGTVIEDYTFYDGDTASFNYSRRFFD